MVNRKTILRHAWTGAYPAEIEQIFRCIVPSGMAKISTYSTPHPQAVRFYDPSLEIA
ncbi:hypothetical protein CSC02_0155 [Enterobacter hormaechei subsp. hoffmannii]|nr:hypothetical protein CSC02_0155 [Enterobacter hormaechei subsp. hoffmannii]